MLRKQKIIDIFKTYNYKITEYLDIKKLVITKLDKI